MQSLRVRAAFSILKSLFAASLAAGLFVHSASAGELPINVEADYERAVSVFNQGKYADALKIVEEKVLSGAPDASPALEMKALCLKSLGRDAEALKAYAEVIRVGPASEKPKYYFEVGSLLHRQKRFAQARVYLNAALDGDFNVGASHFFLGLIDFADRQYAAAEHHFVATIGSQATDLYPLAYFYLGIIYYRDGYPIGAIRGMRYAGDAAQAWQASGDQQQQKSGEEIADTAHRILKSLDTVRWFGNVAFLMQYDSNVSVLPDSVAAPDQTSGKRSLKQILTGGGGIMTSPVRMFQVVASYRLYVNANDNSDAKNFEFFSHMPALYINYKPFLRLTPGIKVDGNYTFQNLAGRNTEFEYHPYSLTSEIGPYVRYEVNPHLILQLDGYYTPQKYYQDPSPISDPLDQRTGDGFKFRFAAEYASPWKYVAVTPFVTYDNDNAQGLNWQYTQWTFGFSNLTRFSPVNSVTVGFDVGWASYGARIPQRNDMLINARVAWMHALTRHFSVLTDVNYSRDSSNLDALYTYTRFYGGMGLSYTF